MVLTSSTSRATTRLQALVAGSSFGGEPPGGKIWASVLTYTATYKGHPRLKCQTLGTVRGPFLPQKEILNQKKKIKGLDPSLHVIKYPLTALRPLICRGCRALPPSATLGLPYATGSAEKCLPRAAAINRSGGGQPLPPQPTCSSNHRAIVPYGVIDFGAQADPGVVIAGLVAGMSDSSRGGYYTPAEHSFYYGSGAPHGDLYTPAPIVWQRPESVGRNQASHLVGIGPPPYTSILWVDSLLHNICSSFTNINQHSASLNDLSTPTPAQYYSQRLPPIAELSRMDVLMNMVQRLLDDNTEIKQRVGVLETGGISPLTPAPANRRIATQCRGRITQAKTRG
ncbi:hypothetical protein DFH08DRAFT_812077 [Mycena albidolilacea]|uniref:Uncharacterized protein n=1 Tax=Mycena albidolilacea TaxID=1033008 RepID=A0AAD6ZTY1_9AGAR|nr:hypothetical protein DFH08DRAFT_812077 [Mycena albidolilacea]